MAPWPWIAVTAYATSVIWSMTGGLLGVDLTIEAVKDWQTLIAGLATVAALVYAGRQLQLEQSRDRRAFIFGHREEWEALEALEEDLKRFRTSLSPVIGALLKTRSPFGTISVNVARWERLNQICGPKIDGPLREFLETTIQYNQMINRINAGTNPQLEDFEVTWLDGFKARLTDLDHALCVAISESKWAILSMAPEGPH